MNDKEFEILGPVDCEFLTTAIIEQSCRGTTRSAGVGDAAPDTVRRQGISRSSLRIGLCSRI
jgi:hypothetical protein